MRVLAFCKRLNKVYEEDKNGKKEQRKECNNNSGCHWCDMGKNNMNVIVQIDGKNIVLQDGDVQEMVSENEDLKKTIADYEMQISVVTVK